MNWKKELNDKKLLSRIFLNQRNATLIISYVFFDNVEFSTKEITDKFNELYLSVVKEGKAKRDLSNEINAYRKKEAENIFIIKSENKKYKLNENGKEFAELLLKESKELIDSEINEDIEVKSLTKGDAYLVKEMIDNIKSGSKAKIPTFQREYVWKNDKVPELLYSLMKNYPIGSMLVWTPEEKSKNYILLDGLQRTFSLTLIDMQPHSFMNYQMYKWFCNEILKQESEISENRFNSLNKQVIKLLKDDKIISSEEILSFFEYNHQIDKLSKYITEKWSVIKAELKIPVIKMDHSFNRDDSADVFNLINSQGVELNNYEKNSSIWSKTPIDLGDIKLKDNHFIIEWRNKKEVEYRSKLNINGDNIVERRENNIIEPSDFIYSIIQTTFKGKNIVFDSMFTNERVKTTALEPIATLFLNILGLSYPNDMDKIGESLSKEIKTMADISKMKEKLEKAVKKVNNSLKLIENISTNSKKGAKIKVASSLMSLLINIALSEDEKVSKLSNDQILSIFIREFFTNKYSTSSTKTAWTTYNSKDYLDIKISDAEAVILNYIDSNTDMDKIEKNHDDKKTLISSLFRSRFVIGQSQTSYELDHIIPRSLFNFENNINTKLEKNYVNSIYNLQLLPSLINNDKSNMINPNIEEFYIINKLDSVLKNKEKTVKEFNKHLSNIYKKLCKQSKGKQDCNNVCKKVNSKEKDLYHCFYEFIEFQKNYIKKAIEENGLLSNDGEIKKITA